jgi:hypothetical protein
MGSFQCGTENAFKYCAISVMMRRLSKTKVSIFIGDGLLRILGALFILGLLTLSVPDDFPFSFEKEMTVQLKPPWELRKLSSVLYEFLNTSNREEFAKAHRIFYQDGKTRVYVVVDNAISQEEKEKLVSTYWMKIEKESGNLLRALVPADELASLAKEAIVLSISLPDRPVVQGKSEAEEGEVKK